MENKINLKDGFIKQNMVFMSGMLIAPVIACSSTIMKSVAVCFVFSLVSFLAILICRAVPRTIVYTLRVIIYSVAAAVVYIPALMLAEMIFGEALIKSAGVYLPILITNSLILTKTETRFYHEPFRAMALDVIVFIVGFDIACVLTGAVREYLGRGRIFGREVETLFTIPALETTFGGFLFVGIAAGLFRAIYNYVKKKRLEPEDDDDEESLAEYAEDIGEFLVGKTKTTQTEKIKIYKTAAKKAKIENELLELEFLSNDDILEEFAAIVAEGAEINAEKSDDTSGEAEISENDEKSAETEDIKPTEENSGEVSE